MTRAGAVLLLILVPVALRAQEPPPRLEPLKRIGCADCSGAQMFGAIQDVAVAGGLVYVADRGAPFIRVFTPAGTLVRAYGRAGDGPGELRLPISVVPRARGGVEVYDMRQRRFTRYDSAGGLVRTRSAEGFPVVVSGAPGAGPLYVLTTDFRSTSQPLQRLAEGEERLTPVTVLTASFPRLAPGEHARTPAVAAWSGGVAVGDGVAEYRIRVFDAAGRAVRDVVRDVARVRKTAAEIEQEREQLQRRAGRMQAMARAEGVRDARVAATVPPERNHFDMDALDYDERGRLWVRTGRGGLAATVFDLFESDGRYAGEVRVAGRIRRFDVHDGILAGVVRDADEVDYVMTWRVR